MIPCIDGDILLYECGYAAETGWKHIQPFSQDPPDWGYVKKIVDERINEILIKLSNTFENVDKPKIFLTGKNNFRDEIAKKRKYKGTRKSSKPFHYHNIKAYLQCEYYAEIVDGMEADDALAIELSNSEDVICCTRDKDLRQVPGWHFGWELAKQPQYGPKKVDEIGELILAPSREKLTGCGSKFFFAQCLLGDNTDNIPGLPHYGPVETFSLLENTSTYLEMEKSVVEAYRGVYGDSWKEELIEQARLVWMVRELDVLGKPIMWELSGEY